MAIKTISLELDAYERLKRAKRGSESFSQVVRRAQFEVDNSTGEAVLRQLDARYGDEGVSEEPITYWAERSVDLREQLSSPSHWADA